MTQKAQAREFWVFENSSIYGDVGDYAARAGTELKPIHVISKDYHDQEIQRLTECVEARKERERKLVEVLKNLNEDAKEFFERHPTASNDYSLGRGDTWIWVQEEISDALADYKGDE